MDAAPVTELANSFHKTTLATCCAVLCLALLLLFRAYEKAKERHLTDVTRIREEFATQLVTLHEEHAAALSAERDSHMKTAVQIIPVMQDFARLTAELKTKVLRRQGGA
jgi:hypothetical protein